MPPSDSFPPLPPQGPWPKPPGAGPAGHGKKPFPIILIVMGGIVAYWLLGGGKGSEAAGGAPSVPGSGTVEQSSRGGAAPESGGLGTGAKLSQFDQAGGSACVIGPDGTWHAVFQECASFNQPLYIYHRMSRDGGRTWSAPQDLTDDGTGNGAGFPQMAVDAQGQVYAAWVRFGQQGRVIGQASLDGPGGYEQGTLTVRRWTGSGWGAPTTVGTAEKITTFSLVNARDGSVQVVWVDEGSMIMQAPINGGGARVLVEGNAIPGNHMGSLYGRLTNLAAAPLGDGSMAVLVERKHENQQELVLWQQGQVHVLYSDPKYMNRNTFMYPPRMFADASGSLHVVYIPHPQDAGREEVRDLDLATGQQRVIFAGSAGNAIPGFQLVAAGGRAHVAVQLGAPARSASQTTDVGAVSFDGAKWSAPRILTGLTRGQSFNHTNLPGGEISSSQRYHAAHASMALDGAGRVHALTTIKVISVVSAGSYQNVGGTNYNVVSGGSFSEPALFVLPWE